MLKFFYAVGSCALASHIALEEAGAEYDAVRMKMSGRPGERDQHEPEFLALNPAGRVPVLLTNRGPITENPAILAYVAQTFPERGLMPLEDPFAFARAQAFNSYLCSTVHPHHSHRLRGTRWAQDPAALREMARMVPQKMAECFGVIEKDLGDGPWVFGERFSVSDGYLFTVADWLEGDGVDPTQFPKMYAIRERVRARPAVQRVVASWGER